MLLARFNDFVFSEDDPLADELLSTDWLSAEFDETDNLSRAPMIGESKDIVCAPEPSHTGHSVEQG